MPAATTPDLPPADRHKDWHSRGYLPHCDVPGLIQSITFRLGDSLPSEVVATALADKPSSDQRRERLEVLLNAGRGDCWLALDDIAALVQKALLHFDGQRYQLLAWCVMPNHVHMLSARSSTVGSRSPPKRSTTFWAGQEWYGPPTTSTGTFVTTPTCKEQ
jgi:putative transposase